MFFFQLIFHLNVGNIVSDDEIMGIAPETSPIDNFEVTKSFRLGWELRDLVVSGSAEPLMKVSILLLTLFLSGSRMT